MGLSMISLAGALAPLRRLAHSLLTSAPVEGVARAAAPRVRSRPYLAAEGRGHVAWPQAHVATAPRRIRVLRVVDAGHAPSTAGRMVISGRMADVCAELDRLAALESAPAA